MARTSTVICDAGRAQQGESYVQLSTRLLVASASEEPALDGVSGLWKLHASTPTTLRATGGNRLAHIPEEWRM